jgi:hypothetical protein
MKNENKKGPFRKPNEPFSNPNPATIFPGTGRIAGVCLQRI